MERRASASQSFQTGVSVKQSVVVAQRHSDTCRTLSGGWGGGMAKWVSVVKIHLKKRAVGWGGQRGMERSTKHSRVNRIEADGGRRDEKIPWLTQFVLVCVHACACLTLGARLRAQEGKISGCSVEPERQNPPPSEKSIF